MNEQIQAIVRKLEAYNAAYREGSPLVSDRVYDELVEELRRLDPGNAFLSAVEPETFSGRREVRHPVPMLSTDKAYTLEALERFVARVAKAAQALGILTVTYRVTPKLDGLAGRDDGEVFVSRGNGQIGYEISSAFQKGVIPIGGRGLGVGEIVIVNSYFETHLANKFEHPRNMVVGIISSDTVNEIAQKALDDGVVHFVPYNQLVCWEGQADKLLADIDTIVADLAEQTDYPMDGAVADVVNPEIRDAMGATSHHYRWQIAIKKKGATAITEVVDVYWQVGRTGNVTPVMAVKPVLLSGATIRRVTAHHAGMVAKQKLGPGAAIEIVRSGEVIPKLERVFQPADQVILPRECPVCGTSLVWQNDFLRCTNRRGCRAQIEQRISHWFKTLGNADWFGIKSIQKMVAGGFDTLEKIYAMTEQDFVDLGFGPVQSKNLAQALIISRTKQVADWRFLAALGITNLGKGDSRKLLSHISLQNLLNVEKDAIASINGFGGVTSQSIYEGLQELRPTIEHMLQLGFNLELTPLGHELENRNSPISGKGVVFTGKMQQGSRGDMQNQARQLGARVQTAVSTKTDLLVCGEKVGEKKLDKARNLGVTIVSEDEYLAIIKT